MSANELSIEDRIASRIDQNSSREIAISSSRGGVRFENASQVMDFAKMLSVSGIAIPKHLRGNPGACLAIVIQAIEWKLSPFAVANKSYSVNDRLAYESQLIQAVILQRAPIKGRLKVKFNGTGDSRVCRVWAELRDNEEIVEYESPPFGKITPKNSPLWKTDPDQQQFYYSGRALCRRHFPDVLLGVYAKDELESEAGPNRSLDIMPPAKADGRGTLGQRLDALAKVPQATHERDEPAASGHDPETGEIYEEFADQLPLGGAGDSTKNELDIAMKNGFDAFFAGMSRKAIPGEYRLEPRWKEADAWIAGFDTAAKEAAEKEAKT